MHTRQQHKLVCKKRSDWIHCPTMGHTNDTCMSTNLAAHLLMNSWWAFLLCWGNWPGGVDQIIPQPSLVSLTINQPDQLWMSKSRLHARRRWFTVISYSQHTQSTWKRIYSQQEAWIWKLKLPLRQATTERKQLTFSWRKVLACLKVQNTKLPLCQNTLALTGRCLDLRCPLG